MLQAGLNDSSDFNQYMMDMEDNDGLVAKGQEMLAEDYSSEGAEDNILPPADHLQEYAAANKDMQEMGEGVI